MKFLLRLILSLLSLIAILYFIIAIWIKLGNGTNVISNFITNYMEESTEYKYKLELKELNFSFPLTAEIKEVEISNEGKKFLIIEDFCINIAPSLFWLWEVNIWNVSAKQIVLFKLPVTNNHSSEITSEITEKDGALDFIPTINISNVQINKIVLAPELTSTQDDIIVNLDGKIVFNSLNKTLHFSTNIAPDETMNMQDSFAEIIGKYHFIDNTIGIENYKISTINSTIEGNFNFNFLKNLVTGKAIYETSILKNLITTKKIAKSFCTGGIEFSGKIDAPLIKAGGQALLEFEDQSYFRLPKLVWSASLGDDKSEHNGKISVTSGSLKAIGDFGREDSKFYLRNFAITGENLSGKMNLVFDSKVNDLIADLDLNSSNISELNAFFPFINKGSINIKTKYSQNNSLPRIFNIVGNIKNLSTSLLSCEAFDIDIAAQNISNLKIERGFLKARSFSVFDKFLKTLVLETKAENDGVSFVGATEALYPNAFNLKIDGKLTSSESRKIDLSSNINGKIGKVQISTGQAIKVTFDKELQILVPSIKANDGTLALDLMLKEESVRGKLTSTNFPVAIFPYLLPSVFDKSSVSGNVELTGDWAAPRLESKLNVANIDLKDNQVFANLQILSGVKENQLSVDAQLQRGGTSLSSFQLQLPYRFSLLPFEASFIRTKEINAKCKFTEESRILSLVPMPFGHKLSGYLKGQLNIYGLIGALAVDGEVIVSKAEYIYQQYGIKLKNIAAKLISQKQNVSITNFMAEDARGNKLLGDGALSIKKDLPFRFHLSTNKFNLVNNSYVQGELAGDLSISGNNQKALAKGVFAIGPMEFKIPERFSDNIPSINIVNSTDLSTGNENNTDPYILDLDIDLSAKKQVYVRGWGVDTSLVGNLKINNTISDPHIVGKLRSVRGKYQEFGKTLTVREGVLTFNGPISPSPYINIVGFSVVSGTEIRLILSGSIFSPDIRIESTPSLNQENALSLLLFRKNTDSISIPQAVTLASSMARLSGHGGGFDVLDIGRKLIPVDEITINQDQETDSTIIGIGKYVTDKIYVEFEQGNQTTGSKQRVEVELTPKVSVEGTVSQKEGNSIGVNWRFDY